MKIGANTITNCKIGNVQVKEVRIGSTLVWSGFDADAQLFITNAGITDATQQTAVNNLVVALKGYGIWTKMKALYPFVGGTASQHKFNLKNPLDTDAAFRLGFNGGITHNSNGITGNGTNGYFQTFLIPSVYLQRNNISVWAYSRTQLAKNSDGFLFNEQNSVSDAIQLQPRNLSNQAAVRLNSTDISFVSNSDSTGLFGASRLNSSSVNYWIRGVKNVLTLGSSGLNTSQIVGLYFQAALTYSQRNVCFNAIGDGLTDTEAANMYTAVQTFQVTLNRQV